MNEDFQPQGVNEQNWINPAVMIAAAFLLLLILGGLITFLTVSVP